MPEPDFRQMGDPLNDRLPPDRGLIQSTDDMSPEQIALHNHYTAGQRLNIEIGRLRQRESMLEAQIEVLELAIGKLRCVCDAAFTVVRMDGDEDGFSAWQELVSALEDIDYQPVENDRAE